MDCQQPIHACQRGSVDVPCACAGHADANRSAVVTPTLRYESRAAKVLRALFRM